MSVTRPARQRRGHRIDVVTNSFNVTSLPTKTFYQYDVVTNAKGEINNARLASEIVDALQLQNPSVFTPRAAYDGKKIMFSSSGEIRNQLFSIQLGRSVYKVKITKGNAIQPRDIQALISPQGAGNVNTIAVTLLQILVRQAPHMRHNSPMHMRSFFTDHGARQIGGGLDAWRGFFQSVKPVLGKLIVNIDVSNSAVYRAGPLIDVVMEMLGLRGNFRNLATLKRDSQEKWTKLKSFLKNLLITVKIPGAPSRQGQDKPKKIRDIINQGGLLEFTKEPDNVTLTVDRYFQEHHNYKIRYPDIFGVRTGKTAVFPAEVCHVVAGQPYKKRLSPDQTKKFVEFATQKPTERINAIKNAVSGSSQLFDYVNSDFMRDSGMAINSTPITIQARQLDIPKIGYDKQVLNNVRNGGWNVMGQRFINPRNIQSWAAVVLDPAASPPVIQNFMEGLRRNLQQLGVGVPPGNINIRAGNPHQIQETLNAVNDLKPTIIVIFLPNQAPVMRKEIKHWGDILAGVPTQCVRAGKYERAKDQYFNNVALKINAKIGGVNSVAVPTDSIQQGLAQSMVIGCDVNHPAPGVKNRPSVASLVSSVDPYATQYLAQIEVQEPRQEMVDNLSGLILNAIKFYSRFNIPGRPAFPKFIIFFRDGVSEGEYAQVQTQEIPKIDDALQEFAKLFPAATKPQLVFIVVGKRHHTRFFTQTNQNQYENCRPGLVVDDQIIHSNIPDFYLQSHGAILGTSRPSHYIVLRNDPGLSIDDIQEMSFALCHVYAAATRSVSIPAPVYYADRACARAEFHFPPDVDFEDAATVSSEGSFDIAPWKKQLQQAQTRMYAERRMYFI